MKRTNTYAILLQLCGLETQVLMADGGYRSFLDQVCSFWPQPCLFFLHFLETVMVNDNWCLVERHLTCFKVHIKKRNTFFSLQLNLFLRNFCLSILLICLQFQLHSLVLVPSIIGLIYFSLQG